MISPRSLVRSSRSSFLRPPVRQPASRRRPSTRPAAVDDALVDESARDPRARHDARHACRHQPQSVQPERHRRTSPRVFRGGRSTCPRWKRAATTPSFSPSIKDRVRSTRPDTPTRTAPRSPSSTRSIASPKCSHRIGPDSRSPPPTRAASTRRAKRYLRRNRERISRRDRHHARQGVLRPRRPLHVARAQRQQPALRLEYGRGPRILI